MKLKTFIKNNAFILILSFFCLGIFIGLSGSIALILLTFLLGMSFGIKINKTNFKNHLAQQAREIIVEGSTLIKLPSKRKRLK